MKEQLMLNEICHTCGKYGTSLCATCPIECLRQQMILKAMRRKQTA